MKKLLLYDRSKDRELKQEIELAEDELAAIYRLGRSPACEICINWCGHFLSAYQLTLSKYSKEDEYSVTDGLPGRPSRNGTWINGNKLTFKMPLRHGDRLICAGGMLEIEYVSQNKTPRLADGLEETLTFERELLPSE